VGSRECRESYEQYEQTQFTSTHDLHTDGRRTLLNTSFSPGTSIYIYQYEHFYNGWLVPCWSCDITSRLSRHEPFKTSTLLTLVFLTLSLCARKHFPTT
jgi:hypothetical protein